MPRGGRGQRSFGSGATAARGAKRKAMASGEVAQMVDSTKKTNPVDSWTSPPIAQQPLNNQMMNLMDGVGMGEGDHWYHDSYPGDIAYSGQHW